MTDWRHTFQLKDLLTGRDVLPEEARSLGIQVAQRLEKATYFRRYRRKFMERFEDIVDQEDFNAVLSDLYDAADELRIWVK